MGRAYLRYSFAQGTVQEIDFLIDALCLTQGQRVLDVGCGPGRHSHELARRGILVHGIDISQEFIEIAQQDAPLGATFERLDARDLLESTHLGDFDAVICLCQGAFGLMTANGDDELVVAGMAHSLKIGGRAAISAFNKSPTKNGATPRLIAFVSPFASGTLILCANHVAPNA